MLVTPQKIRHLFTAKSTLVPAAWIAILIWAFVKVPSRVSLEHQHANVHGSGLSWAWLSALNSAFGVYATLAVNIPDFTVSITYIQSCHIALSPLSPSDTPRMSERTYLFSTVLQSNV